MRKISIFHCSIRIISRSGGRSAVASAAYRSGEKLYNKETGITHDFTKKQGIIHSEIMLPENAPEAYLDREKLWNEVQKAEQSSNAQLAREIEVAFPNELNREQQLQCARQYISENFVSKGMIADWALHDKGDGNPHAHIMLTVRDIGSDGSWLKKQRSVFANARTKDGIPLFDPNLPSYDPKNKSETSKYRIPVLDENGNQKVRIRKRKGEEKLWVRISIPENDWNDRNMAEEWRSSWARCCNHYLEKEKQIDHRSYKRQGLEQEPTIHEGVTARKMEASGKISDRCEINRKVRERNSVLSEILQKMKLITGFFLQKARSIIERFNNSIGSIRDAELSGETCNNARKSDTKTEEQRGRKRYSADTAERVHEDMRKTEATDHSIDRTDRSISKAEQHINETGSEIERIERLNTEKRKALNERFNKLKTDRRAYGYAGGRTGEFQSTGTADICPETEDTDALLREIRAQRRDCETAIAASQVERAHRDAEQKRSGIERSKAIENGGRSKGEEPSTADGYLPAKGERTDDYSPRL